MQITVKYLFQRGKSWQLRRRVPDDIRSVVRKREWVSSLGQVAQPAAIRSAQHFKCATDSEILRARAQLSKALQPSDREAIYDRAFARAIQAAGGIETAANRYENEFSVAVDAGLLPNERAQLLGKTRVSEALERDQSLYPVRSQKHQAIGFRDFIAVNGDLAIDDIKRDYVMRFVAACRSKDMSEATIRRRLGALGAVLNRYDQDHDITRRNPFSRVPLPDAGPTKADREPLTESQVAQFDEYLSRADRLLPRTVALLWLVRSSTLGPSEAGGLTQDDIVLDHDILHVIVRPNYLRPLKAKSRIRVFPLIGAALYHAPALPAEKFCANSVSATLNKTLRRAVPNLSAKQSSYSFRHRMRDRLYDAGASPDESRYLMGHSTKSSHDRYGASNPNLDRLRELLTAAV